MRALILSLFVGALAPVPAAHAQDRPDAQWVERLRAREAEILDAVHTRDPDKHARLLTLKQTDPGLYAATMWRLRHLSPEPTPDEIELRGLQARLQGLRDAHPDGIDGLPRKEQQAVRAEVAQIAERIFAIRQAQRRARLDELKASIAELEADVAARDAERDTRIQRFVDRFLTGPVDL